MNKCKPSGSTKLHFASSPEFDKAVILSAYVNANVTGCTTVRAGSAAGGVALLGVGEEIHGCDGRQWA